MSAIDRSSYISSYLKRVGIGEALDPWRLLNNFI